MAVELGRRVVKDDQTFNDYAIGITLPIQRSNVYFAQAFESREQVRTNILNLLLTKKRERVMQPEFGSGLHELVFDFNDDTLANQIESVIEDAIALWLPYVSVTDIEVSNSNAMKDSNRVEVSITFSINGSQELDSVTFTL